MSTVDVGGRSTKRSSASSATSSCKTVSKMFCGCRNEFGGEPNTNVCPVCLALPGALPVPNANAIEQMSAPGSRSDAEIPAFSKFDRKNYFYPDMPKDYQISQYDMPLTQGGVVRFLAGRRTRSRAGSRASISKRTPASRPTPVRATAASPAARTRWSIQSRRRAADGVRLEPDIRSAAEAVALSRGAQAHVRRSSASPTSRWKKARCAAMPTSRFACRQRPRYGTKAEIKNMNSFRSVHRAIESEIDASDRDARGGGRVVQETRGWDEAAGVTHSMRSKEQAHDYRYFPEPDLTPIEFRRSNHRLRRRAGRASAGAVGGADRRRRRAGRARTQIVDEHD